MFEIDKIGAQESLPVVNLLYNMVSVIQSRI